MKNFLYRRLKPAPHAAMGALILATSLYGATASADSTRGAQVFEIQGCGQCHALNGQGPKIGPDLGEVADRGFTPAALAATMWNHAPQMWVETKLRSVPAPAMNEQQAADLFAFFYGLRFFEEPGDAARGKALFAAKHCAECHGTEAPLASGPNVRPISQWRDAGGPVELVQTMWNHSTEMRDEMARRKISLPQLSGQELADILVYTRRAGNRQVAFPPVLQPTAADAGKALFDSKGCNSCHGALVHFLAVDLRDETLTDIAADMWNHGRDMNLKTTFAPGEMRQIADYIWYARAVEGVGESGRGAKVFAEKKCTVCHDDPSSGAPSLAGIASGGRFFSGSAMVSALTQHGPAMLDKMREKHLAWPHFTAEEMSNLIAYLNTRGGTVGK